MKFRLKSSHDSREKERRTEWGTISSELEERRSFRSVPVKLNQSPLKDDRRLLGNNKLWSISNLTKTAVSKVGHSINQKPFAVSAWKPRGSRLDWFLIIYNRKGSDEDQAADKKKWRDQIWNETRVWCVGESCILFPISFETKLEFEICFNLAKDFCLIYWGGRRERWVWICALPDIIISTRNPTMIPLLHNTNSEETLPRHQAEWPLQDGRTPFVFHFRRSASAGALSPNPLRPNGIKVGLYSLQKKKCICKMDDASPSEF